VRGLLTCLRISDTVSTTAGLTLSRLTSASDFSPKDLCIAPGNPLTCRSVPPCAVDDRTHLRLRIWPGLIHSWQTADSHRVPSVLLRSTHFNQGTMVSSPVQRLYYIGLRPGTVQRLRRICEWLAMRRSYNCCFTAVHPDLATVGSLGF
jgi:hypothetical protein